MIGAVAPSPGSEIVDVGGGASTLVDALLDRGFRRVTVVDVAATSLQAARDRLGPRSDRVRWMVADVRTLRMERQVDLWHDRAVFHFMTSPDDQAAYLGSLRAAVRFGGHVIVAAFDADGPPRCSGLPVARYDAEGLARRLGPEFEVLQTREKVHTTPRGVAQLYTYGLLRRVRVAAVSPPGGRGVAA